MSSDEFESRTDGGREGFGRFGTSSDISRPGEDSSTSGSCSRNFIDCAFKTLVLIPDFNKQSKLHKRSGKRRKRDKKGKGRSKQGKRKEVRRLMCKFYLDGKCTKVGVIFLIYTKIGEFL